MTTPTNPIFMSRFWITADLLKHRAEVQHRLDVEFAASDARWPGPTPPAVQVFRAVWQAMTEEHAFEDYLDGRIGPNG